VSAITAETGIAQRLAELSLARDSGILTATQGKLKRLLCLERGAIVHAVSNVLEEQFLEVLVRREIVTPDERDAATAACLESGDKPLTWLVRNGIVPEGDVARALVDHVKSLVFATLRWSHGEIDFARGKPKLDEGLKVSIPAVDLILEHARHHPPTVDEVRVRIGPPGARPHPSLDRWVELGWKPDGVEADVVALCDGELSITELVDVSPHPPERAWRALYGLVLLGAVSLDTTRRPGAAAADPNWVSRDELLARLQRADDVDFYGILDLISTAEREEVRSAYYFLARRYHPDRFRAGTNVDLLPRVEEYFSRVTQAYNTLYDPIARADYDRQLAADTVERKTEEQDPTSLARQNFLRARSLIERGRYTDAAVSLENAIQLDPSNGAYHLELGRLLARNPRRREEAEGRLREAIRVDPARAEGYVELGSLYRKMARPKDAAEMFREALRWEPGHVEAEDQLLELARELPEGADGGLFRGLFRG
jgi:curved DNA-binding protein CbpA